MLSLLKLFGKSLPKDLILKVHSGLSQPEHPNVFIYINFTSASETRYISLIEIHFISFSNSLRGQLGQVLHWT